jgi:mannose-6-phosphate isomerase-like protein (cupin superfamily)
MNTRFDDRYTHPEYSVSKVVFYPDRVYHAVALAASPRCVRYRYNVQDVRSKLNITVLRGEVYLDGQPLCRFLRLEYRAARLAEAAREQHRVLGHQVQAWIRVQCDAPPLTAEAHLTLHYDPAFQAYYVEIWDTLEAPATSYHDFAVLDLMGWRRPITRVRELTPVLRSGRAPGRIEVAFAEPDRALPAGVPTPDVVWDNNLLASHQEPRTREPSASQNTVSDLNYLLDFQRGWFLQAGDVPPVRYLNALMDLDNPDRSDTNIIEMRWLLQRVFGSSIVFFHEVIIPPGTTEGTHQHIGSEELYYIVEGQGTAYMGVADDPTTEPYPTVARSVYTLGSRPCKELPVRPGSVLFTKSGGIHGIRNTGTAPLKFVAFLYHTL